MHMNDDHLKTKFKQNCNVIVKIPKNFAHDLMRLHCEKMQKEARTRRHMESFAGGLILPSIVYKYD